VRAATSGQATEGSIGRRRLRLWAPSPAGKPSHGGEMRQRTAVSLHNKQRSWRRAARTVGTALQHPSLSDRTHRVGDEYEVLRPIRVHVGGRDAVANSQNAAHSSRVAGPTSIAAACPGKAAEPTPIAIAAVQQTPHRPSPGPYSSLPGYDASGAKL
jgi:hypothetical protein